MVDVTLEQLTESTVDGTGVFDKLMAAHCAHLDQEFGRGRIKGAEYSTVYLGALQSSLDQGIRFLLEGRTDALIAAQIALAEQQVLKAEKEVDLVEAQIRQTEAQASVTEQELLNLQCEKAKCEAETDRIEADTLNVPKQGQLIDAQRAVVEREDEKVAAETARIEADHPQQPQAGRRARQAGARDRVRARR